MQSTRGEFAIGNRNENRESICQELESLRCLSESIKLENQTITRFRYQYYTFTNIMVFVRDENVSTSFEKRAAFNFLT